MATSGVVLSNITRAWLWAGVASLTLIACGGGGGEEAPAAPTPTPTSSLSIRAGASEVSAGDGPVDLEAVLVNANNPVLWSLAGPGTLSSKSGSTVRYTPPTVDAQRVRTSVRITASSRDLVGTLTILVRPAAGAPAPVPGTSWEIVSYPKTATRDLNWLDGRFFAVTGLGGVLNSTDGITWAARATPGGDLMAITHGPGGFLAVGRSTVLKSVDGDTWVDAGATGDFDYWDVAAGNGVFVANGIGGLAVTVDGAVWAPVGPPIGRGYSVAFGAGRFVAVSEATVTTSVDGSTWTTATLPNAAANNFGVVTSSVAYGNGRFVVATDGSHYTSIDGTTWSRRPADGVKGFKLRFANGVFYLIDNNIIWSSGDGATWNAGFSVSAITRMAGMVESAGRTVIADGLGQIRHRAGFGELRDALPGPSKQVTGMTALGDVLYAVTDWGGVLRSPDARTWETVAELPAGFRGIVHGNGRLVAVSDAGARSLYTSVDGRTWTAADDGGTFPRMSAVAHGGGVFVACGSSGEVLRSADGQNWVLLRTPSRVELTGIAYGAGRFVAVSIQGQVISSLDGVNWTTQRDQIGRLLGITYGPQGFVLVGGWRVGEGFIWTSPDGLTWTKRSDASTPSLIAVGHGNGRYIAAGHRGALMLSEDGVRWQARALGIYPDLQAVTAPAGRFVAAGGGGAVVMSEQ